MSDPQTVRLWEKRAPLATGDEPADIPSIAIYKPDKPDGSSIIICPGGGYQHLAPHEGEPVARWLNTFGVTGIVLTYRIAPRYRHPAPFIDVSRAMRTVRAPRQGWEPGPTENRLPGFSPGRHLAATISTHFDTDEKGRDAND